MSEARALALFVTVFGPAACAGLAWLPATASQGGVAALALGLALTLAIGETFEAGQRALRERGATRLRFWVLSFAAGVVFLCVFFAAAAPRRALLGRQTLLLLAVEAMFLMLPGLSPGRLPALGTAAALATLAAFSGGARAALATLSFASGITCFLVFDHFAARLALHPAAVPGLRSLAVGQALRLAAPVVLALLVFGGLPPRPHAGLDASTIVALRSEKMAPAYLQLAFFAATGAAVVYYASRLLRQRREARPKAPEQVIPERAREEALLERPPRSRPAYAGRRGGIVRAYVRFLAEAALRVLERRPDQTPAEIAARLTSAGAALARLTGLFARARYGPDEPSDADLRDAERLGGELSLWLQSRRKRGNPASSRHSGSSPSVRIT